MSWDTVRDRVARLVAGDIALSSKPCRALRRWRKKFEVSQTLLAEVLDISPSVVSDYESGRRKSPGVAKVKRIVEAFLVADREKGGNITEKIARQLGVWLPSDIVLDMLEFENPMSGKKLCEAVEGEVVANEDLLSQKLFGYTVIDGPKAITGLSSEDFIGLYGLWTERALVFTKVSVGRSPLVAIKVRGITPGAVVLHGEIKESDEIGLKIAENLRVPLIISRSTSVKKLLKGLRASFF